MGKADRTIRVIIAVIIAALYFSGVLTGTLGIVPALLQAVELGTWGLGDIYQAVERGEVNGFQSVWSSAAALRPHWVEKKLVNVLAATSLDKIPAWPATPPPSSTTTTAPSRMTTASTSRRP